MERREHQDTDSIQGEGDYRSAREYRDQLHEFLERADVEKAAREAAPRNPRQARELERAEEAGRSHARDAGDAGDGLPEAGADALTSSLRRAVRERPVTAILVAAALGYLVRWARHR